MINICGIRPMTHLSVTALAAKAAEPAPPQLGYVGCYDDENMLGQDRIYNGHTTGAHMSLAVHHGMATGKRYIAMARSGNDGHAFAFDTLTTP